MTDADRTSDRDERSADPLDELVPGPWSTGRRILAGAAVLLVVAAVLTLAGSGLAGPRLSHTQGWGGSLDTSDPDRLVAERIVPLRNDGLVPVRITGMDLPELEAVTWGEVRGVPTTLGPRESAELVVELVVAGCDVHVEGYDVFGIRAQSGVVPERVIEVPAPMSGDPTSRVVYQREDGEDLVLPEWPDQPPSWILDAIDAGCRTPPDDVVN